MKKTLAYTLLISAAFAACKPTPKTNAEDEAKKAEEQRKEMEANCYSAVKTHLLKLDARDSAATIDTIIVVAIDTATEKMARENFCHLNKVVKDATDYYVEQQEKVVEASKAIHMSLAEPEIKRLEIAKQKQKIEDEKYSLCLEELEKADDTNYKYYQVTVDVLSTNKKGGKDTTHSKQYVTKDFDMKLF